MATKKLAERKKVKREAEKKQKLLRRQDVALSERRQKNIDFKVEKMMKARQAPIRNSSPQNELTFSKQLTPDEIRARLNHNLEILQSLEEEYDKEMAARQERNGDLEEDGCVSLKEKMDALHGKVLSQQQGEAEGLSFGGEAEVVFTPNEEKETAV